MRHPDQQITCPVMQKKLAGAGRAAFGGSAALHAAALLALIVLVHLPQPAPHPQPSAVAIVFLPGEVQPVIQSVAAADLPRPVPLQATRELAASLKPLRIPGVAPARTAGLRMAQPAAITPARPVVPLEAAPAGSPAAPAASAALSALEAQVSRAVQDAAIYPPAARMMRRQGRAQLRFAYADGAVSNIAVAAPSAFPMLDQAAATAVRRAALPRPPAALEGRRLTMLVWVRFALVAED